jgi:hypothetical protein
MDKKVLGFIVLIILCLFSIFFTTINLSHITQLFIKPGPTACNQIGPGTSAPNDLDNFHSDLSKSIASFEQQNIETILYTTINSEAAINNFPVFIQSILTVVPPLIQHILIFCLDPYACEMCRKLINPIMCVKMDFGVGTQSLAPYVITNNTKIIDKNYFKLTFGRFYAAKYILNNYKISVVSADVDSIFLRNPFAVGEALYNQRRISTVMDAKEFHVKIKDGTIINGGFIYFPAISSNSWQLSKTVINKIWNYNCKSHLQDDQLIISHVLRKEYSARKNTKYQFNINTLPGDQYLSYCNTNCGEFSRFANASTIDELHSIEQEYSNHSHFINKCTPSKRRKWVFFHVCCIVWPHGDRNLLSIGKSKNQKTLIKWVDEAYLINNQTQRR